MQQDLAVMAEIAQPLDEWCEFCTTKLATGRSADGVLACDDCQKAVIEALQKYEREALEAADHAERAARPKIDPGKAKAKAKRRAKRKRTKR